MDKKIIKGLAGRLASYGALDMSNSFSKLRFDCPGISQEDQTHLNNLDAFHGQLELKKLVGELLQGSFENWAVNTWIVHQWGGIRRFNILNHERITGFRDSLRVGLITIDEFDRISSLSKIASFVSRDRFFIYDSRVAFSLDGFLLKMKQENPKLNIKFFPLPSAQGGRDEMMRRIIRQLYPDAIYLTKEETYAEYNSLILNLSKEKELKKQLPPCWIEMLLFALGKTDGVVEHLFDFSRIKAEVKEELKRRINGKSKTKKASKRNQITEAAKVVPITPGAVLRSKRNVLFGYVITFEVKNYYLFVGEIPSYHYLELLTEKSKGRIEECSLLRELECMGFNKKGKDYIYKPLRPYDKEEAKRQLDEIVKRMTNNDQE